MIIFTLLPPTFTPMKSLKGSGLEYNLPSLFFVVIPTLSLIPLCVNHIKYCCLSGMGKILQLVRMGAFGISRGLLGKHNQEGKERKDIAVFLVEGEG